MEGMAVSRHTLAAVGRGPWDVSPDGSESGREYSKK